MVHDTLYSVFLLLDDGVTILSELLIICSEILMR